MSSENISSILSRHKIRDNLKIKINDWIESLTSKLSSLERIPILKLDNFQQQFLANVKCPIDDQLVFQCDPSASFSFHPPNVHIIGSYALGCCAKKSPNNLFEIDIALEIPKSCWQKHDHRNFIYHWKRAFYLAYIAKFLSDQKALVTSVKFSYFNGNHWRPCILIEPAGKLNLLCRFKILAVPTLDKPFVKERFLPDKCNIRNVKHIPDLQLLPESTPYYNYSILKDLSIVDNNNNKDLKENFLNLPNVQDALILMRIWLNKRNLRRHFSYLITEFTFDLLSKQIISSNSSPFHIFSTILHRINTDFKTSLSEEEYFFYDLPVGLYDRLKLDAERSYELILKSDSENLIQIFDADIHLNYHFDFSIHIPVDCCLKKDQHSIPNINYGSHLNEIVQQLYKLFTLAIGDRVSLIQYEDNNSILDYWNITNEPPKLSQKSQKYLSFGILIKDNEKFHMAITKGPMADDAIEAKKFRNLWKEKSEMRRFQDGDIRECVVWTDKKTIKEKRLIIMDALKFVLNRHMNIKPNMLISTIDYLDDLLTINNVKFNDPKFQYGTGEECLLAINNSIMLLKKYLHTLELSTFQIIDVLNVDPVSRQTDVFPPLPLNSKPKNVKFFCNVFDLNYLNDKMKYVRPINLIVKIESNQKMANNLEEFRNQKYLFNYELGKMLVKTHNLLVREHCSYADVYVNGFVFRLNLVVPKEISILRQMSNANRLMANKTANKYSEEADKIEFETQVLPAISSAISSLQREYDSYSLTCRLFKRWLSRQMIKHFFEEITLDLLVAAFYLDRQPINHIYLSSHSHFSCFLRLLKFLANFDFVQNAIILNFNQTLSNERILNIRESFVEERSRWPIIFIVTPYDRKLSYHSLSGPDTRIVFHMKKLAQISLNEFMGKLSTFELMKPIKSIMNKTINMDIYDIIIKLNSKFILNKYQSMDFPENIPIKYTVYSEKDQPHVMPITDFNPSQKYLKILQKSFENLALFFYDEFGGKEIGVLLKPDTLEHRPFKYSSVECSKFTLTSNSLKTDNICLNIEALCEDFKIIGQDLVDDVIVKSERLLSKNN